MFTEEDADSSDGVVLPVCATRAIRVDVEHVVFAVDAGLGRGDGKFGRRFPADFASRGVEKDAVVESVFSARRERVGAGRWRRFGGTVDAGEAVRRFDAL